MGGSPQFPRRSPYPHGLQGRLGDPEAKAALDPTPRGASLILAEFLEAQAVAYVMKAPPVEEAVWLAGVISAVFVLAGGSSPRPCIGGRPSFTLVLFYLALGA